MLVTVHLLPTRKETRVVNLEDGSTVEHVIRALGLLPDGWVAVRGEAPIPSDEHLKDGDTVKLISVVSGG